MLKYFYINNIKYFTDIHSINNFCFFKVYCKINGFVSSKFFSF